MAPSSNSNNVLDNSANCCLPATTPPAKPAKLSVFSDIILLKSSKLILAAAACSLNAFKLPAAPAPTELKSLNASTLPSRYSATAFPLIPTIPKVLDRIFPEPPKDFSRTPNPSLRRAFPEVSIPPAPTSADVVAPKAPVNADDA